MNHILVVEPDRVLGTTYKDYLEQRNYKVSLSQSVEESINLLDEDCPDLLILELQIAGHNGIELLYEIRSYQDWRNLPVIVNTVAAKKIDHLWLKNSLGVNWTLDKFSTSLSSLENIITLEINTPIKSQ